MHQKLSHSKFLEVLFLAHIVDALVCYRVIITKPMVYISYKFQSFDYRAKTNLRNKKPGGKFNLKKIILMQ